MVDGAYHKLLGRQLSRVSRETGQPDYTSLFAMIDDAYKESDKELQVTNRAMNLMSLELLEANKSLKNYTEELKKSEERYELAANGANDGIWDWNLITNKVYYSDRWKEMIGCTPETVLETIDDWLSRIHPDYRQVVDYEMKAHISGKTPRFESEYQIQDSDETYRWMLAQGLALRNADGQAVRIAGSQTDISERKLHEAQLEHAALHDPLTNLPNRTLFTNRLEQSYKKASRLKMPYGAILFVDLDRFKVVNDSLGHQIGDQLLCAVGKLLESLIRPGDTVARLGGDEFVVLLEEIETTEDALVIAERLIKLLKNPIFVEDKEIHISGSVGVALISSEFPTADAIMRNADLAMYEAKAQGRNRSAVFNKEQHTYVVNQMQLENDLRVALERRELFLVYQPIVNIAKGTIVSFEALIRWKHPKRGIVSPLQFIPIAEDAGLIQEIGQYVLETACKQLKRWMKKFPDQHIGMSVNLSMCQLADSENFHRLLDTIIQEHLPPGALKIELTESAIAQNISLCSSYLQLLKNSAVDLCIDDFGTGYSSLSQLDVLPFDVVKIDRSFINRMPMDDRNYRMVLGIIKLSHDLNFKVVAEGVETIVELSLLRQLDCDYAQGFYFSKPVIAEAAEQLIIAKKWEV